MKSSADLALALRYAPIIHFDENDTIPLRAVGCTVFRETAPSLSFPKRMIRVPQGGQCVIEYAYYFDYDIQHMYDLEHVWVEVGKNGEPIGAEGSFHGKYLRMLVPQISGTLPPEGTHVHAFCQPGKHAFVAAGDLVRLVPEWYECCNVHAGGPVLIGNPFCAEYSPTGQDLFIPTREDDERSVRYIRERLAFQPSLRFREERPPESLYMLWEDLFHLIPGWIAQECERLKKRYGEEK